MAIKVVKPGLSTTVQDLGRPGYYHIGIPISGGMDRFALCAANWLVGNKQDAAVLEATFLGPELEFTTDATVAVTGAELPPKVDGQSRATWTSFKIRKGQTLAFDFLKAGARGYIAISGGVDVPVVLGSRSTYALGALGGYHGRKLAAGDELALGSGAEVAESRTVPARLRRAPGSPAELRMMPGLYWHRITERASISSRIPGKWRRRPTGSATDSVAGDRSTLYPGNRRLGPAPIPPTSSTPATPMAPSRCRAGPSRSCCIVTRSRAAATS
jgi:biotin-dependent carboxylase-like uncharacterized protein